MFVVLRVRTKTYITSKFILTSCRLHFPHITESHVYEPKNEPIITIKPVRGVLTAGKRCVIMATVAVRCLRF